ncbi:MAG: hypothetical protein WCP20_15940 [Desulfuromonadales bacterium]
MSGSRRVALSPGYEKARCPDDDSETKAATKRTMRDGIEIAAIGIMDSNVRYYWDNHRIIKTIQELPAAMFGIMEGLLTSTRRSL